jgi:hypothetical protein
MKAVIPIFLIAIAAGVAAFMVLDPLHDRAGAYKSDNEAILDLLTPPAEAKLVSSEQVAYEDEGISSILNRAEGWVLTIVYGVPEATSIDDLIAWYRRDLPAGWAARVEDTPDGADPQTGAPRPPLRKLFLTSGEKLATLDFTNMNPGANHTYQLSIDHKGAVAGE